MKRKILAISLLLILVAMLAWSTVAYFTAEDQVTNVLTIGSVKISLKEFDKEGGLITQEQQPGYFRNVEPGQRLIKRVVIENQGENKAWIRAKIIDSITSSTGTLDDSVLSYNVNHLTQPLDNQTVDGEWEPGDGGYYYFPVALEPGQKAVLFDVVSFSGPNMGNAYQGCQTDIQVIAQAVQFEGNETCDPDSWPAEPESIHNSVPNESGGEQP